ncbi:MAG: DNA polymerase III subunit gamma/tau, partial [bacterium]|nr:DNA polymerase III subunit gamma/tau [bacterium]
MANEGQSYTVLARKRRPQRFGEVVGQEHVTTTLQNALAQKRVGQGYLFIGTRGVGKTTIARIFAKALNCLSGKEPVVEPCDRCSMCEAIREGTCLDVIEIDGASNRGIEEIRRLRDSVAIAPVSARYKIYIIDEVHMLTKEAFNALLKTLEEPPGHVKFFMATTEVHRVPATILSRVQKFELRRIGWKRLMEYLEGVARGEGVEVEAGALATIARAGNGSVRDALSVFDQVLALAEERVTEEQVTALLGWTDREIYAGLHEAIVKQDVEGALRYVEQVMERGRDAEQFVLGLIQFLRNVLIMRTVVGGEEVIEEPPEFVEVIKRAAGEYTVEQLLYSIDVLLELLPRMAGTEAKQTSLELAVLKVMYGRRRVGIDEIFARLEALEGGGGGEVVGSEAGGGGVVGEG